MSDQSDNNDNSDNSENSSNEANVENSENIDNSVKNERSERDDRRDRDDKSEQGGKKSSISKKIGDALKKRSRMFWFITIWFVGLIAFLLIFSFSAIRSFELSREIIAGHLIGTPKFVNDANAYLQAVLLESSCTSKHVKGRFYLYCERRGRSPSLYSHWDISSGLWEVRGRANTARREGPVVDEVEELIEKGSKYSRFRIHPVDQKAMSLARYIQDRGLMGAPVHGAEATTILSHFKN